MEKEKASFQEVMAAYEKIFNAYRLQEVEQVSDKEKFSKSEALQEVIENIIKNHVSIEKGKEYHYLRRAVSNKMRDAYDHEKLTEIFAGRVDSDRTELGILEEIEAGKGYGLTEAYISDIFRDIKKTLTVTEFEIWEKYTIQDQTAKTIADYIGETEVSVCRKLKKIFKKIIDLHHAALVDSRYVAAIHPARKSYYKPYTEDNGEAHTITRETYENTLKTPVMKRRSYKNIDGDMVFLRPEYDAKNPKGYVNVRQVINAERAQILKTWAQVWKEETKGIRVERPTNYTGPADCLMTYRVEGRLMVNSDGPRYSKQI